MPWDSDQFARQVQEILASVEAPPVDAQVHRTLQKYLYRSGIFDTDGRGHITLLVRTILESENNQDALIEPIVSAVSSCMRPEWTGLGVRWIECFDSIPLMSMLSTLRDLFGEHDLLDHYCIALRRKIAAGLEPVQIKPQEKAKPPPKPPAIGGARSGDREEHRIGYGAAGLTGRHTKQQAVRSRCAQAVPRCRSNHGQRSNEGRARAR